MENVTVGQIIAIGGVLIALWGVIKFIGSPVVNLLERLKKLEEHDQSDDKRIKQLETDTKQILLSINVLLEHSIDNNHTGELSKRQQELNKYIIERNY